MKMVKSLILGSAAGLVAMSGAQAADLPVKAKAVEYVRICSLYGAGFYYIPGTDTCIKLGGYLRVDMYVNANSIGSGNTQVANNQPGGFGDRFTNAFDWRSREDLNIDTRTATEYGVVRTFFDAVFQWTDDNYSPNPNIGGEAATAWLVRAAARALLPRPSTGLRVLTHTAPSASTMPTCSSPGSRSVRPSRRSALPGPCIRATTMTASSAAAARLPVSASSPIPLSSATAFRAPSVSRIRPFTIRLVS